MRRLFPIVALIGTLSAPAFAQERRGDHAAVERVIMELFDAMRAADTAAMGALFHASGRVMSVGRNNMGEYGVIVTPIDRFIALVGGATAYLDERIWDLEIRIDGDLATVWTKYAFFANEQFSHCGVDAFQLARLTDGWKIIQISDTRRRDRCEIPPAQD